ncbi:hypothetical protein [Paenibacillus sp. 453mf]|uniref:hypothetical protein n=1 Tax=Paenibacillus sp. 453mf TaxID=1761874 RepID=UPI0008F2702B|nr:hypothetical protein [Paenibacillus sp. 453mf]SFS54182.1 hypothetical protein SAMN04488601_1011499 [Paenibacillus sp. 453mf]
MFPFLFSYHLTTKPRKPQNRDMRGFVLIYGTILLQTPCDQCIRYDQNASSHEEKCNIREFNTSQFIGDRSYHLAPAGSLGQVFFGNEPLFSLMQT